MPWTPRNEFRKRRTVFKIRKQVRSEMYPEPSNHEKTISNGADDTGGQSVRVNSNLFRNIKRNGLLFFLRCRDRKSFSKRVTSEHY